MSLSARPHATGTLFDKEPEEDGDEKRKENEEGEPQSQQYFGAHTPAIIRTPENPEP